MSKDFDLWNIRKKGIDEIQRLLNFNEREVWWCCIGLSVGREQDGKNADYERPVLVIKKYNDESFLALAITSRIKEGRYYFNYSSNVISGSIILSQMRLLSSKRLLRRISSIPPSIFIEIKKALFEALI